MQAIFPFALLTTGHALMTALVVIQGLAGNQEVAADIALVQGAALALFFAFSANARSLILSAGSERTAAAFLKTRLILAVPLFLGVVTLSVTVSGVAFWFAVPLVLRRLCEWLSEVALSELERTGKRAFVLPFVILDIATWLFVAAALIWTPTHATTAMWIWAVVPLVICAVGCAGLVKRKLASHQNLDLLPHLGSSAVVGVTVYVFRLLIVLLVGKSAGGDLITAFAIGSLAGTIVGSVVGPSLVLHDHRSGAGLVRRVTLLLVFMLLAAAGITALATGLLGEGSVFLGKSTSFWWATVLSLVGGAVMVVAQILRLSLIQRPGGGSAFGADVTANVLVIAAIPFFYYLVGREALGATYLATSVGALLVYGASNLDLNMSDRARRLRESVLPLLYFLVLFPVFVQIESGLFRSTEFLFDSGGVISRLPVPLSVIACFAGLIVLGRFEAARFAFGFIFFAFVAMLVSGTLTTVDDELAQQSKLILTAQFLLPMFAMAFGQMAGAIRISVERVARAFLSVLLLIVPIQLLVSWMSGISVLRPDLGAFSVYQHLQYVPAVLGAAYVFCAFVLWDRSRTDRRIVFLLGPVIGIYAAASGSMLAIAVVVTGLGLRAIAPAAREGRAQLIALAVASTIALGAYNTIAEPDYLSAKVTTTDSGEVSLLNFSARIPIWRHYSSGITESVSAFLIGHQHQPDRERFPSAHNYYLDLLYNFGFVGLLPVLAVILLTLVLCWRYRATIIARPPLLGLAFAVAFTVLLDNSFKVGLRQPYPGMFTFFMWGLLMAQLRHLGSSDGRSAIRNHD
ncbi:MAG: hypothetical protein WDZ63_02555 [Burkholderiales bacterium]